MAGSACVRSPAFVLGVLQHSFCARKRTPTCSRKSSLRRGLRVSPTDWARNPQVAADGSDGSCEQENAGNIADGGVGSQGGIGG